MPDGWNDSAENKDETLRLGTLETFSQKEFVQVGWSASSTNDDGNEWTWGETQFTDEGYIYTPNACLDKECYVHFAFHGCGGTPEEVAKDDDYYGLSLIAATNDIIMVYPGSNHCFNDGGYFDNEYWLTNEGLYPTAFRAMMCRVTTEEGSEEAQHCPQPGPFAEDL